MKVWVWYVHVIYSKKLYLITYRLIDGPSDPDNKAERAIQCINTVCVVFCTF